MNFMGIWNAVTRLRGEHKSHESVQEIIWTYEEKNEFWTLRNEELNGLFRKFIEGKRD